MLGGSRGGEGSSSVSITVTPLSVEFSRGRVRFRECGRFREELRRGAGFGWEENRG